MDDHILLREGLVSLFESQPDIEVVGEAGSVEEAVTLTQQLQPDLILMDFGLPDGNGLDATQRILSFQPDAKIVFLTVHEDDEYLFEAIRIGAKGYLLKNIRPQELLKYVREVARGGAALTPNMTRKILSEFARVVQEPQTGQVAPDVLTEREWEIACLIAKRLTNREIAEKLVISENTVKNHIHNILSKLGLNNRRQIAKYYQQQTAQR